MKRNQRIRWYLAAATRLNAAGAPRTADVALVTHSYLMSANTAGTIRTLALGYSGADYWV